MTALKAKKLAEEHNFNIHDTERFDPCESDGNSCPNNTPLNAFQPITTGDVHKIKVAPSLIQANLAVRKFWSLPFSFLTRWLRTFAKNNRYHSAIVRNIPISLMVNNILLNYALKRTLLFKENRV